MQEKQVGIKKTNRNYQLDCYRILAILMVLSVHVKGYLRGGRTGIH